MKTPDEIKRGLEFCGADECHGDQHTSCPYNGDVFCIMHTCADALAYIQQIEAQNAELFGKIEQLQAERDAAVETIYEMAKCITEDVCEWCDGVECERLCMHHAILRPGFKWRGVQKEDSDA